MKTGDGKDFWPLVRWLVLGGQDLFAGDGAWFRRRSWRGIGTGDGKEATGKDEKQVAVDDSR